MMKIRELALRKREDILDYEPLGSVPFDYDDFLNDSRESIDARLEKLAPSTATHFSLSSSLSGEPIIHHDYNNPEGVRRTCFIQYWRRKAA